MRLLLALALLIGAALDAEAASFDCAKAASATEKAICATPRLSALDAAVAQAYDELREGLEVAGDGAKDNVVAAFVATQRAWLRDRNGCGGDAACLGRMHDKRLAVLGGAPDPEAASPLDGMLGRYEAGDGSEETYDLAIVKGEGATALVLFGAASQNWTCSFSGIGKLDAKGGLVVVHPGSEGDIRLTRAGAGLHVTSAEDHVSATYCGMGGSLAQSWRRAAGP